MMRVFVMMLSVVLFVSCSQGQPPEKEKSHSSDLAGGLVFDPAEVDLGEVMEGKHASAVFLVRNNSDMFLNLADIVAPCGCTTAEPGIRVLDAGAFTQLKVDVDTFGKLGQVRKSVSIKDQYGRTITAWINIRVLENKHMNQSERSIFDGKCAACHVTPALHKSQGREIYQAVCAMCHGIAAEGAYAPALTDIRDAEVLSSLIAQGTGSQHMPGFAQDKGGPLDEKQLKSLVDWLISLDDKGE
ncbi:MAG: succinate dehydrogenase [Zetaproteobacteria bacterium CG_4_9_14_3_um_filter_49_83]|nr:MAG: hypothetical protein AUJ56_05660 [Zetaproteobacteria bacterium CG1_02_49_23]PIQ30438.1 MAG: succinate dehydrogenase [Zetaproteobacteria bacterium CG17_big_fil_post_rev_8_21_14_2_50_50_13]PIV29294.1 MAG: succinate dehydrogenase [Zetaproteobacteria bacterium CG02_land_8_20_14_3_00_50_9]PIY56276.1 MAG: succinate dehydrogenase [Zetaproteobacteria bacterium CG_4_10_14_0_8_um_filter_49_80]PJA34804.1 MAG: succinate dehydrogenase [Zetaproteobacteria bacterium CG_4_9_14_3_um_filter_49_83]